MKNTKFNFKEKYSMEDVIQFPFEYILMLVFPSRGLFLR